MYKWNMGGTPKELYDAGVTVSMEERKATIGDYLKSEKVPAAYSDPSDSGKDIEAVSTVTPKYNESASVTENLELYFDSEVDCQFSEWLGNVG